MVTILALGVWAFGWEPASFTTRNYPVSIPHWHTELAGLRVAVLADLHVGSPYNGLSKLHAIVNATNSAQPDLILIPGDLVIQEVLGGRFIAPEETAAVLAGLKAPLGVWAVLGNHDWWLDGRRARSVLEKNGIHVLEDRASEIRHNKASFWLVGVSDFWEGAHDFAAAMRGVATDAPVLLFTHNPDVFPRSEQPSACSLQDTHMADKSLCRYWGARSYLRSTASATLPVMWSKTGGTCSSAAGSGQAFFPSALEFRLK